jgi:hypothetical protein
MPAEKGWVKARQPYLPRTLAVGDKSVMGRDPALVARFSLCL